MCVCVFQKKKICLQNVSDGIKHTFQTDTQKTCQYLWKLCLEQHKFHQQLKTRQSNQEQQELGTRTVAHNTRTHAHSFFCLLK